jgi:hypothetical protein
MYLGQQSDATESVLMARTISVDLSLYADLLGADGL